MSDIETVGVPEKSYLAGGDAFLYPGAGDPVPPGGAKVLLLTEGGVCTIGHWNNDGFFFLGWAPLPKRDKQKEAML
jgi:hypothetical protein